MTRTLLRLRFGLAATVGALLALAAPAWAQKAPFDLAGPTLRVMVTRGAVTLPISRSPDLAAGDVIQVRAELPPTQAARYLLVVAFLQGATNPPPKTWFYADKTWERGGKGELTITTPKGAQQAIILLAPSTEGDFDALRAAVRARPGAFVRASQDLNELGRQRSRLETFLSAVRQTEESDPARLQSVATDLARTLGIKLDVGCFGKPVDLQAPCLMQDQDSLVLSDSQDGSLIGSLSNGVTADLITQIGAAPQAGGGAYSAYVGAVLDIARLLNSLRTAHFQYVPALAAPQGETLRLRLNTTPSFGAIKSVLVVALPPVMPSPLPALHETDENAAYCLVGPKLVLKVDGAPLAFSTDYAQDLRLEVKSTAGKTFEVPLRPDPEKGGLVGEAHDLKAEDFAPRLTGSLNGLWGFTSFQGPSFTFVTARPGQWRLEDADRDAVAAGREDHVRIDGGSAPCVSRVEMTSSAAAPQEVSFKPDPAGGLGLTLPLGQIPPGPVNLKVYSAGLAAPDDIQVQALLKAISLKGFDYHAGDAAGVLRGEGLEVVARLDLGGIQFAPRPLAPDATAPAAETDRLTLATSADDKAVARLASGARQTARVTLTDGRVMNLPTRILPTRPNLTLLAQSLGPTPQASGLPITLEGPGILPRGAVLTFSVRIDPPTPLSARETLEVATGDGSFSMDLNSDSGLIREDTQVAVGSLDSAHALGPSAFGPLQVRLTDARGESDWKPLGVLVRLPSLTGLACARGAEAPCELSGSDLFLIQAAASRPDFSDQVQVPEGFPGAMLQVPHPKAGKLYLKLHDDPDAVGVVQLAAAPRHRPAPAALIIPGPKAVPPQPIKSPQAPSGSPPPATGPDRGS